LINLESFDCFLPQIGGIMIYRILSGFDVGDEKTGEPNGKFKLVGAGRNMLDLYLWMDVPAPSFDNPKAKFFWTEDGFKKFGLKYLGICKRENIPVKVIRLKNPKRSSIVYRDRWQLAVLRTK
jgi:hypothetical protein